MLTQREKDFILYWEENRFRKKKIVRQFLVGIPIGLLFAIPILINYGSGWDRRADMEANNPEFNPIVLMIALLLIVGFTAIFYQRQKWDQYDQRYKELIARRDRPAPATGSNTSTPDKEVHPRQKDDASTAAPEIGSPTSAADTPATKADPQVSPPIGGAARQEDPLTDTPELSAPKDSQSPHL